MVDGAGRGPWRSQSTVCILELPACDKVWQRKPLRQLTWRQQDWLAARDKSDQLRAISKTNSLAAAAKAADGGLFAAGRLRKPTNSLSEQLLAPSRRIAKRTELTGRKIKSMAPSAA